MMLPSDDFLLLSVVNTKLRDFYADLDDFCDGEDCDREDIEARLNALGYFYDKEANAFK